MTKGRKAISTDITPVVPLNENAVAQASSAVTAMAQLEQAVTKDALEFAQRWGARIGRRQMAVAMTKLLDAAELADIQQLKDSGDYKGKPVLCDDGELRIFSNWEDFCREYLHEDRKGVDNKLALLRDLGEDVLNSVQQIGANLAQMRAMRALPGDERALLIEAAEKGDKTAFFETVDAVISNHTEEKKKAAKKAAEQEQKLQARQAMLDEKNAELDTLKEAEAARTSGTLPEREAAQLAQLQVDTETAVNKLAVLLATVDEVMNQAATQATELAARQSLDYVVQRIVDACADRGISVDLADRVTPIWAAQPKAA